MPNDPNRPLRIGRIDYANVWPVVHYFDPAVLPFAAQQWVDKPAVLNRMLENGSLDLSAVSSYAFGKAADQYYMLPDLSISAYGQVRSILLLMRAPLEQVKRGTIALTTASDTSVNLLKIIMNRFYGGDPVYVPAEPNLPRMLEQADAALLIGDDAIRASWSNHGYETIDLGEAWFRHTGSWMTFALWAVRRDAVRERPQQVRRVYEALVRSKQLAARDLSPIVDAAARRIGGTENYWRGYFHNLAYDFGPRQLEGLTLYFRYLRELGLLERQPELAVWPPHAAMSSERGKTACSEGGLS